MKKLSVCVALLILIAVAFLLMRRSPPDSRGPESASVPQAELNETFDVDHPINEVPEDTQVIDVASALESGRQQVVVAPIAADSPMVTNDYHAKTEVPMNMLEHDATIPVVDEERSRFVRIAFDRAKEAMEITDTSTATVEYKDNIAIVTFPFPRQTMGDRLPYPGPDYLARVKIDRATGNVLEILGAP